MTLFSFSVVGLGKLGTCMAACIASKGFDVIGVDVDPRKVNLLNNGEAPVLEPHLQELITANRSRLTATTDYERAIIASEVTFIVVPTPSDDHGGFSIRYVAQAAQQIGRALAAKSDYHVVAITSTVLPGATEFGILPILEENSGKISGRDFGLCYTPEFIALGSVIHDFLNPDFVLIGESDQQAGSQLASHYQAICDNEPPVARMNLVNAELTKIALNAYLTTKISFANMLAEMCEHLPGADVDIVTETLGMDTRIGRRYLTGAIGYGGPCFPRDNGALGYIAREIGLKPILAESTDFVNRSQIDRVMNRIRALLDPRATIAVLGLAYKPGTCVVEESQGLYLAEQLASQGRRVIVYDSMATENARHVLGDRVAYAGSIRQCLEDADAIVIANPSSEFRLLESCDLPVRRNRLIVFDCWRILRPSLNDCAHIHYVPLGVGNQDAPISSRLANLWNQRRDALDVEAQGGYRPATDESG
ncbi:nucleotide sugar dehydrogenase [Acidobacteria bacterium AH-259-D05]|nr:nucleotide sugar dehydrogenase [Acidobacteria bacterium AH-259-D05]